MIRFFVIFLLAKFTLFASFESSATYKVGYGFLSLGEARAMIKIDKEDNYESEVYVKTTGLAYTLSGGLNEKYRSVGRVVDGKLVPDRFEKHTATKKKSKLKSFYFDHLNDEITLISDSCKKDKCSTSSELVSEERFSKEDFLSIYHNIIKDFKDGKVRNQEAKVVGEKRSAVVVVPTGKEEKDAKKMFKNSEFYMLVHINQEIFTSKNGELYLSIDDDYITTQAVLKKTMLFGDVWGKLVDKKISRE